MLCRAKVNKTVFLFGGEKGKTKRVFPKKVESRKFQMSGGNSKPAAIREIDRLICRKKTLDTDDVYISNVFRQTKQRRIIYGRINDVVQRCTQLFHRMQVLEKVGQKKSSLYLFPWIFTSFACGLAEKKVKVFLFFA